MKILDHLLNKSYKTIKNDNNCRAFFKTNKLKYYKSSFLILDKKNLKKKINYCHPYNTNLKDSKSKNGSIKNKKIPLCRLLKKTTALYNNMNLHKSKKPLFCYKKWLALVKAQNKWFKV